MVTALVDRAHATMDGKDLTVITVLKKDYINSNLLANCNEGPNNLECSNHGDCIPTSYLPYCNCSVSSTGMWSGTTCEDKICPDGCLGFCVEF